MFFHILCLSKIDLEKVFADVLDQKDALEDHNGLVHYFGRKFTISSTLIFMQNQPRKSMWKRST